MFAFRIADTRHPIFSPTGAMLHGGRWNSRGRQIIYAAETYAGALLEVQAHANLSRAPGNHNVVIITIPDQITVETLHSIDLSGWNHSDITVSRAYGDKWILDGRTAVLRVPGVVTGGRENSLLLNPLHPDFHLISASPPEPVYWDSRPFNPR